MYLELLLNLTNKPISSILHECNPEISQNEHADEAGCPVFRFIFGKQNPYAVLLLPTGLL